MAWLKRMPTGLLIRPYAAFWRNTSFVIDDYVSGYADNSCNRVPISELPFEFVEISEGGVEEIARYLQCSQEDISRTTLPVSQTNQEFGYVILSSKNALTPSFYGEAINMCAKPVIASNFMASRRTFDGPYGNVILFQSLTRRRISWDVVHDLFFRYRTLSAKMAQLDRTADFLCSCILAAKASWSYDYASSNAIPGISYPPPKPLPDLPKRSRYKKSANSVAENVTMIIDPVPVPAPMPSCLDDDRPDFYLSPRAMRRKKREELIASTTDNVNRRSSSSSPKHKHRQGPLIKKDYDKWSFDDVNTDHEAFEETADKMDKLLDLQSKVEKTMEIEIEQCKILSARHAAKMKSIEVKQEILNSISETLQGFVESSSSSSTSSSSSSTSSSNQP